MILPPLIVFNPLQLIGFATTWLGSWTRPRVPCLNSSAGEDRRNVYGRILIDFVFQHS